jgi:Cu/Ag efflux pump CusA
MLKPLAITVIGALTISVLLSLLATPTIYYFLHTTSRLDPGTRTARSKPT